MQWHSYADTPPGESSKTDLRTEDHHVPPFNLSSSSDVTLSMLSSNPHRGACHPSGWPSTSLPAGPQNSSTRSNPEPTRHSVVPESGHGVLLLCHTVGFSRGASYTWQPADEPCYKSLKTLNTISREILPASQMLAARHLLFSWPHMEMFQSEPTSLVPDWILRRRHRELMVVVILTCALRLAKNMTITRTE